MSRFVVSLFVALWCASPFSDALAQIAQPKGTPDKDPPAAKQAAIPAEIEMEGAQASLLSSDEWTAVPDYLQGATLVRPGGGNELSVTAKKDVRVIVAAPWAFDGDGPGDWLQTRMSLPQLVKQGWEPIGKLAHKEQGEHTLLRRTLKAGEKVKFHTRKQNPPVILVPTPAGN